jgi:hypothetical protein
MFDFYLFATLLAIGVSKTTVTLGHIMLFANIFKSSRHKQEIASLMAGKRDRPILRDRCYSTLCNSAFNSGRDLLIQKSP